MTRYGPYAPLLVPAIGTPLILLCALCLHGCTGMQVDEDAVDVKPDAIHIESGAAQLHGEIQKDAVHLQVDKDAVQVHKVIEANVQKDAVHVEPVTISPTVNHPSMTISPKVEVARGAVSPEAVHFELKADVAEGAVKPAVTLTVQPGAFVVNIRGADVAPGAFTQSPVTVAVLGLVAIVFLVLFWFARNHNAAVKRDRGIPPHWLFG